MDGVYWDAVGCVFDCLGWRMLMRAHLQYFLMPVLTLGQVCTIDSFQTTGDDNWQQG